MKTWAEQEILEGIPEYTTRDRRVWAGGIGLIGVGLSLMGWDHRKSVLAAGKQSMRLDALGGAMAIVGGGILLQYVPHVENVVESAPTHSNAKPGVPKSKQFSFRILNRRWDHEAKRLEATVGNRLFWFPEHIRKIMLKARAQERDMKRQQLLEKEAALEESILHDIEADKLTPNKVLQKLSKRVYVLDFADYGYAIPSSEEIGNTHNENRKQSGTPDWVGWFRDSVSLLLQVANEFDQVVIRLTSPGGTVAEYGLAASQLIRLRRANIHVVVCVDTICASGGFLMACCANRIVAAPFSVIGSIGVVAEVPNFHRVLDKYDVDYMVFTAGNYKRTIHTLAENTEEGMDKFREELGEIHTAFKQHVEEYRESVDTDAVGTGESWLASQAIGKGLIDELATSDEYLDRMESEGFDIVEVSLNPIKSKSNKLSSFLWEFIGARGVLDSLQHQLTGAIAQIPVNPLPRLLAKL
uniref:Uncharacterized protein n=1 Tax=Mucochytrium quahogii TaxID=96639 RepID=A0A7S2WB48_9STRA|mmetsp:Transcript_15265/g.24803  ORF Transcript_15265/g.24803 Transcript_15265/m.24803 type:complete len:469 (+) Transcript_15265:165-1571(+)